MVRRYCADCGEHVDVMIIVEGRGEVPRCALCGLELAEEIITAPVGLDTVIVVEDSEMLREATTDLLLSENLARFVTPCHDGGEFLSTATKLLKAQRSIDLIVLDVNLPVINGINAAIALRMIERGLETSRRIPILFFASRTPDDALRRVLQFLTPARYLNKGAESDPKRLALRIQQILARLIKVPATGQ